MKNKNISLMQKIAGEALRFWFTEPIWENHRPWWLKGMELDFFIPAINIGFEVQGRQHRIFVPSFHGTVENFQYQVERDRYKKEMCKERRMKLVIFESLQGMRGVLRNCIRARDFAPLPDEIESKIKNYNDMVSQKTKSEWVGFNVGRKKLKPIGRESRRQAGNFSRKKT